MNRTSVETKQARGFSPEGLDTSLVVFFLAVEIGRSLGAFYTDAAVMGAALVGAMFLPLFFQDHEPLDIRSWIAGRFIIAGFGIVVGSVYSAVAGAVLPASAAYLPFALLVLSALFSSAVCFRNLMTPAYAES